MSDPRLFFPDRTLKRSKGTQTGCILYSAPLGSQHGRGKRLEVYVQPRALPKPPPDEVYFMAYEQQSTEFIERERKYRSATDGIVVTMSRNARPYNDVVRFDSPNDSIHSIYLPSADVRGSGLAEVTVHLFWIAK